MELNSITTMEATSTESEAHETLTTEEEIHCHKARIFKLLVKAPVIRAWKDTVCDGAVYVGKRSLSANYADRYFGVSIEDIAYVTFSIVTAFEEIGLDAEGREVERSQCHISPAQREASEFLIVTFSNDHDRIALLPRRLYWPVEGDGSTGSGTFPDEIAASTLSDYSYSIEVLLAYIEEIKRLTASPMQPTTTPFQISLDGRIPRADCPTAIMPQQPGQQWPKEKAFRKIHKQFPMMKLGMEIDFLDYQPLLRDFKIIMPSDDRFPPGLEVVISHSVGHSDILETDNENYSLRYADYHLTHGIMLDSDHGSFIPSRFVGKESSLPPHPEGSTPGKLRDPVDNREFIFAMDDEGKWVNNILRIIVKYPPDRYPTLAEEKQAIWKKAVPWPQIEAHVALQEAPTAQKTRGDDEDPSSKRDSGMGDDRAEKPSDVSLLAAHYLQNASLDDVKTEEDAG